MRERVLMNGGRVAKTALVPALMLSLTVGFAGLLLGAKDVCAEEALIEAEASVSTDEMFLTEEKLKAWESQREFGPSSKPLAVMDELCDEEKDFIRRMISNIDNGQPAYEQLRLYAYDSAHAPVLGAEITKHINNKIDAGRAQWEKDPTAFDVGAGTANAKQFNPTMVLTPYESAMWELNKIYLVNTEQDTTEQAAEANNKYSGDQHDDTAVRLWTAKLMARRMQSAKG